MSADDSVKRCQPLRAWRASQLAVLERRLQAVLRDWSEAWGLACVELRCEAACDPDGDAAWRTLGSRAGGASWIAEPPDLMGRMALALFAASEANTPVVQRVCTASVHELRERLVATLQLGATDAVSSAAPTAREWSAWSGAVQARLPFDVRLLLAGEAVAAVLGDEGATPPLPQTHDAPLAPVPDALAEVRVPVAAHLDACALGLGTLRGLQLGDVVHLGHRLEQPVQVRDGAGRTLFDAFLSRDGRHKAVELAAAPTTTAATVERALP